MFVWLFCGRATPFTHQETHTFAGRAYLDSSCSYSMGFSLLIRNENRMKHRTGAESDRHCLLKLWLKRSATNDQQSILPTLPEIAAWNKVCVCVCSFVNSVCAYKI